MTSGELADATIVFDLDGTLVDTAPDLVRALNRDARSGRAAAHEARGGAHAWSGAARAL